MITIVRLGWWLPAWRFFRALLAVVVSLLLFASAAMEAGRRLQPQPSGIDGRLVHDGLTVRGSA